MGRLRLETIAPALFVLIWSTGWIVGKFSNSVADPLTFLSVRFFLAALVFAAIALVMKSKWPTTRVGIFHAVFSGFFLHGIYLGGIWWALNQGVPASMSGLLAALQPLMTAMFAYWVVNERLTRQQKAGVVIGFIGLIIAISPGLLSLAPGALQRAAFPLFINVISMLAVTLGTIYQKRYLQEGDLVPVATLQYVGAFLLLVPSMLWLEPDMRFDVSLPLVLAMAWSVLGLSLGAIMLLLYLIRRGQVSRAASLIYLIPPTVAIEAWLLFDEKLTWPLIMGTVVVVFGVWLVNQKSSGAARG